VRPVWFWIFIIVLVVALGVVMLAGARRRR